MTDIKTLWDAASTVEDSLSYLEEGLEALQLWHSQIETSGYQCPENFNAPRAAHFVQGEFSGFLAQHRIILNDLATHVAELRKTDTAIYDAVIKQTKEETPDGN